MVRMVGMVVAVVVVVVVVHFGLVIIVPLVFVDRVHVVVMVDFVRYMDDDFCPVIKKNNY